MNHANISQKTQLGTYLVFLICLSMLLSSCATVPVTGRSQLNFIPDSMMLSMSLQEYDQFLSQNRISNNQRDVRMVKQAGARIAKAVGQYFVEKGLEQELKNYQWEFNLVESEDVNAWCMPGGKVVVYTGILPIARNEAGLAVIMGHEIAHAIAEHGGERMSQMLLVQMGGIGLSEALKKKPAQTQQMWLGAFGMGTQLLGILPFSRLHESEADYLGLVFMTMAGYDPNNAISFWERMAEMKGGQAPPEFLSTHPSDQTRIRKIRESIPEIMQLYR